MQQPAKNRECKEKIRIDLPQQTDKMVFVGLFWERCKKHCSGGIHASRRYIVPIL